MIGAIAESWGAMPVGAWPDGPGRRRQGRRGRPPIVTREHVTIALDAAEIAVFDAIDLPDESMRDEAPNVSAFEVAKVLVGVPRLALAVHARLGAATVSHLIAVNAMNQL